MFDAASVAVAVKVWAPVASGPSVPPHGTAAPSSAQLSEPSFVLAPKVAVVLVVCAPSAGPPVIAGEGGVVSTVQPRVMGVFELPTASTPRTENVW